MKSPTLETSRTSFENRLIWREAHPPEIEVIEPCEVIAQWNMEVTMWVNEEFLPSVKSKSTNDESTNQIANNAEGKPNPSIPIMNSKRITPKAVSRFVTRAFLAGLVQCAVLNSVTAAGKLSRAELDQDIVAVEELVTRAEADVTVAQQLARAGFSRPAQESGVHALFGSDRAAELQSTANEKVDRLAFSFKYERGAVKRQLLSRHEQATRRRMAVDEQAAALATIALQPSERLVSLYLLQRDAIRSRIAQGVRNEANVIEQLSELARIPLTFVTERIVTLDNLARCRVEGDIVRLPDGKILALTTNQLATAATAEDANLRLDELRLATEQLGTQVEELRRYAATNKPMIVTNVTVSPIFMLPTTNAVSSAETKPAKQPDINSSASPDNEGIRTEVAGSAETKQKIESNPIVESSASIPPPATRSAIDISKPESQVTVAETLSDQTNAPQKEPLTEDQQKNLRTMRVLYERPPNRSRAVLSSRSDFMTALFLISAVLGFAALSGLLVKGFFRFNRRRFEVSVASLDREGISTLTTLTVQPRADRIILGEGRPHCEPADLQRSAPVTVTIDSWGRLTLTANSASAVVRDEAIENAQKRLRIGDEIQVRGHDDPSVPQTYVLREVTIAASDIADLEQAAEPLTNESIL
ncbi:MAG: hypothetical protein O2960_15900 [Verrucomicrobia bacterium]|nr:hypothetical protein [Verrucomicrobiota bacterium]